ncbi:SDR family NAD(P)-dependent oxidoreductase [Cereibacter sphaeroides]|uniref:SDR family NAD(P)-dependent oxidoreductase n=1 Tax=Cereibacter sphaeroides TaxID=1063 RepID=UPI0031CC4D23
MRYRRGKPRAARTAAPIFAREGSSTPFRRLSADIATGAALVDTAVAFCRFGRLDVPVNNAGVFNPELFLELTETHDDWYLDTILNAKLFAAGAAARAMKERAGAIVQTGSMWAIQVIGATPSLLRWSRHRSTTPS